MLLVYQFILKDNTKQIKSFQNKNYVLKIYLLGEIDQATLNNMGVNLSTLIKKKGKMRLPKYEIIKFILNEKEKIFTNYELFFSFIFRFIQNNFSYQNLEINKNDLWFYLKQITKQMKNLI